MSKKTVAKLMRDNRIGGSAPAVAAGDDHQRRRPHRRIPDLVERHFDQGAPTWSGPPTSLHWTPGRAGCTWPPCRDGCSRRVLGYAFSDSSHTDVVETALRRAVAFRDHHRAHGGVIVHADRAVSTPAPSWLRSPTNSNVRLSVGRTGVLGQRPAGELWSTLKTEFYQQHHSPPEPRRSTP